MAELTEPSKEYLKSLERLENEKVKILRELIEWATKSRVDRNLKLK